MIWAIIKVMAEVSGSLPCWDSHIYWFADLTLVVLLRLTQTVCWSTVCEIVVRHEETLHEERASRDVSHRPQATGHNVCLRRLVQAQTKHTN